MLFLYLQMDKINCQSLKSNEFSRSDNVFIFIYFLKNIVLQEFNKNFVSLINTAVQSYTMIVFTQRYFILIQEFQIFHETLQCNLLLSTFLICNQIPNYLQIACYARYFSIPNLQFLKIAELGMLIFRIATFQHPSFLKIASFQHPTFPTLFKKYVDNQDARNIFLVSQNELN